MGLLAAEEELLFHLELVEPFKHARGGGGHFVEVVAGQDLVVVAAVVDSRQHVTRTALLNIAENEPVRAFFFGRQLERGSVGLRDVVDHGPGRTYDTQVDFSAFASDYEKAFDLFSGWDGIYELLRLVRARPTSSARAGSSMVMRSVVRKFSKCASYWLT